MKSKILLTKPFFENDIKYIESKISSNYEIVKPINFELDTLIEFAKDAEVFLGPNLSPDLLKNAKKLKLIQVPWTGVGNLELENLRPYNVPLCNSHSNSLDVAEFNVALFLSLIKKIPYHHNELKKGNWNRPKKDFSNAISPFSVSLKNLKIGLLGYGSIASKIHKMLAGFDCDFLVCSKKIKKFAKEQRVLESYSIEDIKKFLPKLDVLFVCLPLTNETENLLNNDLLSLLENSYIINTSRGEIINERALYELLKNNTIKGVSIDTWISPVKEGQLPSEFNFEELDNVILSPHRAGLIEDAFPHLDDAILNLNNLINGFELINIVDINNKY